MLGIEVRGKKKTGVVRTSGGGRERGGGVGGSAREEGGVGGERERKRKRGNISGYNGSRTSGPEGVFSTSASRGGAKDYLHYSARFGGVEHCVGEDTEPRLTRRYSIYLLY